VTNTLNELTARLLDSYAEIGAINHIDGANLPDKQTVGRITAQLLRLLFPGYYQDLTVSGADELAGRIGALLEDTARLLEQELRRSLEYAPGRYDDDFERVARELTRAFLGKLPQVREVLVTDADAAYDGDPAATGLDEIILAYPGLEAIAVQRLAHELHRLGVALIPRMMTEWAHSRTGIDIHPGAEIGTHFFIDHGTGVVIGETTSIGNRVKIYHGVTLGAKSTSGGQALRGMKRHPTIEHGVTIYPGATILGGETRIGEGSTIGGNVFLLTSVPPRSLVYYEEGAVQVKRKPAAADDGMDYNI
jgi:serine O-acetyltransferase